MKTGRLAYTVGTAGERQIDTAELDRVFGIKINGAIPATDAHASKGNVTQERELAALRQQLDDRDATIRDLRARLDRSEEERRSVQGQLTALLSDQRPSAPVQRRSWLPWRR